MLSQINNQLEKSSKTKHECLNLGGGVKDLQNGHN